MNVIIFNDADDMEVIEDASAIELHNALADIFGEPKLNESEQEQE